VGPSNPVRANVHTRALHRDDPSREFRTGIHCVRWTREEAPSVNVTAWTGKDRVVQIQVSHVGGKICEETHRKNPSGHVAAVPKSRWLMHHLLIAGHTLSALFLVESDEDISSFGRSRFWASKELRNVDTPDYKVAKRDWISYSQLREKRDWGVPYFLTLRTKRGLVTFKRIVDCCCWVSAHTVREGREEGVLHLTGFSDERVSWRACEEEIVELERRALL
jgi:hypothetical protein